MHINETIAAAHKTAKEKGFWDKPDWNLGEKLMLVVSELGEALEADRNGKKANIEKFEDYLKENPPFSGGPGQQDIADAAFIDYFKKYIKDSFEDEMADAVIRLFDLAGKMNIDLEYHIRHKMEFNSTRDKLHGKKY